MAIAVNPEFLGARRRLVQVLKANGIFDPTVLKAVEQTPRHLFVPTGVRHRAYEDTALQIGQGQTISQPTIHARYLELLKLKGTERVLEIGTGSGYQTVLLSHLASQVFTIERVGSLMERAPAGNMPVEGGHVPATMETFVRSMRPLQRSSVALEECASSRWPRLR